MEEFETVLITGGAGFIGAHCAARLTQLGVNTVIVDNFSQYYDPLFKEERVRALAPGVPLFRYDIASREHMDGLFESHRISHVVHLAAQSGIRYSSENPLAFEESNIRGTLTLLELSRKYNVSKFVFATSSSVYGNSATTPFSENMNTSSPISVYAATKKSVELLAHAYQSLSNMHCIGLRFFTVYGPWGRPDMAYNLFIENMIQGRPIQVFGDGTMARDYVSVHDIIDGIERALEVPLKWEIVNLGSGNPVSLSSLLQTLEAFIGKKALIQYCPKPASDVDVTYADISRAEQVLSWRPRTSFAVGIEQLVAWRLNRRAHALSAH